MSLEHEQRLEPLATEVVDKLETVASIANTWLVGSPRLGIEALANAGNSLNSDRAVRALDGVNLANEVAYRKLAGEPAIARVVVRDEDGRQVTYYFCRADQGMANLNLVSYRAPVGRLAAIPVGGEYVRPDGKVLTVIERAQLRPSSVTEGWDAHTVVQSGGVPTFTIESLRKLLGRAEQSEPVQDLVAQMLASLQASENIIEGIKRSVITKMGLRDQPVLDQFQDEIFRLPLNRRVLLLGPPGTGKTTTLIRRLGQKLDVQFLDEDEQRVADELSQVQQASHGKSWLMFTPTELLKQYLKEAFAREGIPAPDQNIRTWSDHRRDLARQTFGVLRTATGGGTFILRDVESLRPAAAHEPIAWFEDFQAWQSAAYQTELLDSVQALVGASSPAAQQLGARLEAPLREGGPWPATFAALAGELSSVQGFVAHLKEETDTAIKAALNAQLARNKKLVDELAKQLESLQQQAADGVDADEDQDGDDDEDVVAPRVGLAAAINAYMQAVRTQARNVAAKRSTNKTSRTGKIIEWLGDRTLPAADLASVGNSLLLQAHARRFVNPVKRYIDGIPKRYRAFRKMRQDEGRWYAEAGFEPRELNPLELDVVLLTILRAAGDLLQRPTVMRDIDSPAWASLKPVLSTLRNQIVVDEATDFSPVQLACMAALTHPRLRSFFACGDFNQRLTSWGSRSADELKWVFSDLDIRRVAVTYRQSRQLNELARDIIRCVGGSAQDASLPAEVNNEGVRPVLLEYASVEDSVGWLAARIRWIDQYHDGLLPSTAIFVNSEAEVEPLADALSEALAAQNIPVTACREGKSVGQESNVRVFDVQHIKGLEFEAVFFVGVDQLATSQKELFDKFLYVGTTRAAQYLGMTCSGALPAGLEPLRAHFGATWDAASAAAETSATEGEA